MQTHPLGAFVISLLRVILTLKEIEMSATSEALFEEIEQTKKMISETKNSGGDTSVLEGKLASLVNSWESSRSLLNEGSKKILKG